MDLRSLMRLVQEDESLRDRMEGMRPEFDMTTVHLEADPQFGQL